MATPLDMLRRKPSEAREQLSEQAISFFGMPRSSRILINVAVGAVSFAIGLLAGIMAAPASGVETRSRLSDTVSGAYDNVRKFVLREAKEAQEKTEEAAS